MRYFLLLSLLFMACGEKTIEYKPQNNSRQVFRSTTLSTFQGKDEVPGTKTKIWYQEHFQNNGPTISYQRTFVNDASVGYHKQSLPSELSYRQNVSATLLANKVQEATGFSKFFKETLPNLNLPQVFENELKNNYSPRLAKKEFQLWWQAAHLPSGKYRELTNITSQVKPLLTNKLWSVDSVLTNKFQKVDGKRCLKWDIYYQKDLPQNHYLFEQMGAADTTAKEEFKNFQWTSAKAKGKLSIYNNIENGLLCRTVDWQEQENIITHKETGEAQMFRSNSHTETLYTYE